MDNVNIQGIPVLNHHPQISNANGINSNSTAEFQKLLSAETRKTEGAPVSTEEMLKHKYPDLKYHVADSSGFKYGYRLDFPDHLLYRDTIDIEYLNSWKPTRQTSSGFEPDVQRNLSTIPRGMHVVLIHPACQERMDNDPEYAKQIAEKVNRYFETDYNTNKAIDPDTVKNMSQVVCITENGDIGHHQTVSGPKDVSSDEDAAKEDLEKSPVSMMFSSETALLAREQTAQAPKLSFFYNYIYGLRGAAQKERDI